MMMLEFWTHFRTRRRSTHKCSASYIKIHAHNVFFVVNGMSEWLLCNIQQAITDNSDRKVCGRVEASTLATHTIEKAANICL